MRGAGPTLAPPHSCSLVALALRFGPGEGLGLPPCLVVGQRGAPLLARGLLRGVLRRRVRLGCTRPGRGAPAAVPAAVAVGSGVGAGVDGDPSQLPAGVGVLLLLLGIGTF